MHYYKRNLGDYAKKAGRLSMLQHGSYTLLIDSCYDREQFPTLDQAIEWTWASTPEEIEAVNFVLKKFFVLDDGVYVQKRIQEEIAEYHNKADTNSRIAKERETKRRDNSTNRTRTVHEAYTNREQVVNEPPPNHKPLTNNQEPLTIETSASDDAPVRSKRFIPPNLSEVITAMNARVTEPFAEANRFLNYYEANGWRVGRNPMKSWTHAVNNWVSNSEPRAPPAAPIATQPQTIYDRLNDRSWAD